jgi:hypothetical protein
VGHDLFIVFIPFSSGHPNHHIAIEPVDDAGVLGDVLLVNPKAIGLLAFGPFAQVFKALFETLIEQSDDEK